MRRGRVRCRSGEREMRPRYRRAELPPPMRFQRRDGAIIQAIYDLDGVVSRRQLKAMFWPDKSWRAMEKRLSLLYHNGYLDWPSKTQWRTHPIPEPVCWLGWKGILWLAGRQGVVVISPKDESETQLRKLERELRAVGIRWVREPRWSQLLHDLAVIDFRLRVMAATGGQTSLRLEEWVPESVFASDMDVIRYPVMGRNGRIYQRKRGVRPDGYFVICDVAREASGQPARARFLLELDNATHAMPSFGREKVVPGVAYLKSAAYRERFGASSGRWLVVTRGGERRMGNLMEQTRQVAGADVGLFLFTTWAQVERGDLLTEPVWRQAGRAEGVALFAGMR